jgi:hypothetical protein
MASKVRERALDELGGLLVLVLGPQVGLDQRDVDLLGRRHGRPHLIEPHRAEAQGQDHREERGHEAPPDDGPPLPARRDQLIERPIDQTDQRGDAHHAGELHDLREHREVYWRRRCKTGTAEMRAPGR